MGHATAIPAPAQPGARTFVSRVEPAAVVQVNVDGTASLYLGDSAGECAAHASRATVLRVLLDYTVTLGRDVTVLIRQYDGRTAAHEVRPNGTVTRLRSPTSASVVNQPTQQHLRNARPAGVAGATSQARLVCPTRWSAVKRWLTRTGSLLIVVSILLVLLISIAVMLAAALLWMES